MVSSGNAVREAFALRRALLGVAVAVVVVATTAYCGYVALRYHALEEIRDWDSGLSPATIQFAELSRDPEILRALVLRIENTNWANIGFEAEYFVETKGMCGLKALAQRIDDLLSERDAGGQGAGEDFRLERRLLKLFAAWDSHVKKAYPGMEIGELYIGNQEKKTQFVARYRAAMIRILDDFGVEK
jgi:hypothetical protein